MSSLEVYDERVRRQARRVMDRALAVARSAPVVHEVCYICDREGLMKVRYVVGSKVAPRVRPGDRVHIKGVTPGSAIKGEIVRVRRLDMTEAWLAQCGEGPT